MNMGKYAETTIDELIKRYGAEQFFINERFYESMVSRLNRQDDTHALSRYFQVHVRYLWMKLGLIKPINKKGDQLLFEKGPKFILSRTKPTTKDNKPIDTKKEDSISCKHNAKIYRQKLKQVERKFKTRYPFICGICGKHKRKGMGFYTLCEEFLLCDDCLNRFQFPLNIADKYIFISTPMGGQNKRY